MRGRGVLTRQDQAHLISMFSVRMSGAMLRVRSSAHS